MGSGFYVYMYLRSDFTPYYIGKGFGKRAWKLGDRVTKPPKDINLIFLVKEKLTEEQAFYWETYYIKEYGRKDIGTGILRNLTDGGEGSSGYKHSKESLIKMSQPKSKAHIDKIRKKLIGRKLTEATKKLLSEKKQGENHPNYGKRGEDSYLWGRVGESNPKSKSYKILSPDGIVYHIKGIRNFCKEFGLNQSAMCKVANKKQNSYKGWVVEYD